jgi:hypothetical protein
MACSPTKRIRGRDWPLFPTSAEKTCVYKVQTPTSDETAAVAAAAQSMPGYVKRSQYYDVEGGVRVYIYFDET